jgi:uncharacterized iron-regulated membrane protein
MNTATRDERRSDQGFQGGLRQSMSWLHTWVGLTLSVLLYFMFLTGTAGYFNSEIDRWMQPELPVSGNAAGISQTHMAQQGLARLAQHAPQAREWYIAFPSGRRDPYFNLYASPPPLPDGSEDTDGEPFTENLDPTTGAPYPAARKTGGGNALYAMHYALHYMPYTVAMYIVGIATMFMLVAIVSGIVVHKKIFTDFFTFRPAKGQRSWLDAHNLSSVMALPFMVMITYSGLVFYTYEYMPSVKAAVYGVGEEADKRFEHEHGGGQENHYETEAAKVAAAPASIAPMLAQATQRWGEGQLRSISIVNPGDANARVNVNRLPQGDLHPRYDSLWFHGGSGKLLHEEQPHGGAPETFASVILALHEGQFAGPVLRWLYLASGLLGAAMIATGLVLWTTKRRQALKHDQRPDAGLRFVEHFNVGIVAGLPIAIAAYFWANRLIPAQMPGRDEWEMHTLFIVWALALLHGALRPAARAWIEQLAIATAVYALLPLLNAATTSIHLGNTLPAGDGVRAGFDIAMLALAAIFAWALVKMRARLAAPTANTKREPRASDALPEQQGA